MSGQAPLELAMPSVVLPTGIVADSVFCDGTRSTFTSGATRPEHLNSAASD